MSIAPESRPAHAPALPVAPSPRSSPDGVPSHTPAALAHVPSSPDATSDTDAPASAGVRPLAEAAAFRLAAGLEAARADGLEHFDKLRFRFVTHLAARALDSGSARIAERAHARLDALRADFEERRARLAAQLALARELAPDPRWGSTARAIVEAFERGALRDAERLLIKLRPRRSRADAPRLEAQVKRRSTLPPPPEGDALALATRLYGERSGDAFARRAVAELRDELPAPEDAGPYHASTVAADALAELDAHARPLLRAWLQRLRNLDALRDPDPET
ncbi:MAG: hypothetical protein AAF938_07430 [Myxococcota bacterium]